MTNNEIKLTINMLDTLSDHLGNDGCNDTTPEWLGEFSSKEVTELNQRYHVVNGDPEEDDGDRWLPDYCYVEVIKDRLIKLLITAR